MAALGQLSVTHWPSQEAGMKDIRVGGWKMLALGGRAFLTESQGLTRLLELGDLPFLTPVPLRFPERGPCGQESQAVR